MKHCRVLLVCALALIWAGCGGDDGTTEPPPPQATVVTAVTASLAPIMGNVNDTIWNRAVTKAVPVTSGTISVGAKVRSSTALVVASQVNVQAAVHGGNLYLRLMWADPTFDAWPHIWVVDSMAGPTPLFEHLVTESQDQAIVLFRGMVNHLWDVWRWQAHSTALSGQVGGVITGFAEGATYISNTFTVDDGDLALVRPNGPYMGEFNRPTCLHEDTMAFHGFILPESEADSLDQLPLSGWQVHDTVPGYITDQSLADSSAVALGSRWDIAAVALHSAGQYTVVLRRALNTGYTDDLAMAAGTRLAMKVILTDKLDPDFAHGLTDQGITGLFYLQLP